MFSQNQEINLRSNIIQSDEEKASQIILPSTCVGRITHVLDEIEKKYWPHYKNTPKYSYVEEAIKSVREAINKINIDDNDGFLKSGDNILDAFKVLIICCFQSRNETFDDFGLQTKTGRYIEQELRKVNDDYKNSKYINENDPNAILRDMLFGDAYVKILPNYNGIVNEIFEQEIVKYNKFIRSSNTNRLNKISVENFENRDVILRAAKMVRAAHEKYETDVPLLTVYCVESYCNAKNLNQYAAFRKQLKDWWKYFNNYESSITLFYKLDKKFKQSTAKPMTKPIDIYVAGVDVTNVSDKKMALINALDGIQINAAHSLDKNAIILVVLSEYALYEVIPNKEKKKILNDLQQAIKPYKNFILIPGSFLAYQKFADSKKSKKMREKIVANYEKNRKDNPSYASKYNYLIVGTSSKEDVRDFLNDDQVEWNQISRVQNSSYILFNRDNFFAFDKEKIKHKKSVFFEPRNKMKRIGKDWIFDVGADNPVKSISINQQTLEIGLNICFEHAFPPVKKITDDAPLVEVIISDSILLDDKHLFGAINIHMDSITKLNVSINQEHPKANLIGKVVAVNVTARPIIQKNPTNT